VCILTNNCTTKAVRIFIPPAYSHLESCVVDLLSHHDKLRLFVCYRPPSGNSYEPAVHYVRDLCDCIDSLYPSNSAVILCGDFNFPNVNWLVNNSLHCSDLTCSGIFLELVYKHGLQQQVTRPTRGTHTLDLVFCNDRQLRD
jgi:hypothetical protein